MAPPDKRRCNAANGFTSPIRLKNGTSQANGASTSNTASLIAPPPRAQLTRRPSSPSPPFASTADLGAPPRRPVTPPSRAATTISSRRDGAAPPAPSFRLTATTPATTAAAAALADSFLEDRMARLAQSQVNLTNSQTDDDTRHSNDGCQKSIEGQTAAFWRSEYETLLASLNKTQEKLVKTSQELAFAKERVDSGIQVYRRQKEDLRDLRYFIASGGGGKVASEKLVTDDVLANELDRLRDGLQNWIVTWFKKAKMVEWQSIAEEVRDELEELVPDYGALMAAGLNKIQLLLALTAGTLRQDMFEKLMVGLTPEQEIQIKEMRSLMTHRGNFFLGRQISARSLYKVELLADTLDPAGAEASMQWRSVTLSLLASSKNQDPFEAEIGKLIITTLDRINRLFSTLTKLPAAEPKAAEIRDQSLQLLLESAAYLQVQAVCQRAKFRFDYPGQFLHSPAVYDENVMEDAGVGADVDSSGDSTFNSDEQSLGAIGTGKVVSCVVFPGLVKRGDENGENIMYVNVVTKAMVMLRPA